MVWRNDCRSVVLPIVFGLWILVASAASAQNINVYPPAPSVRAGANQQFSASVTGLSGSQVTWAVNGAPGGSTAAGTITSTGLYTGPATIAPGTVAVQAISTVNTSVVGSATVTLWNPMPGIINIEPNTINSGTFSNVVNGRNFVSGATATFGGVPLAVTYISSTQVQVSGSTTAAAGTSVPLVVTNPQPGSASSTLNYVVQPPISVTITPSAASLYPNATKTFNLTVLNTSNRAVTWLVNGIPGGNSVLGAIVAISAGQATYTAPSVPPSPNTVSIQARSVQNTSALSPASIVTLTIPTISVYPPASSVRAGANQQFSASAAGLSGSQVTWAVNGISGGSAAFGTITGAGLYTGPPTIAPGTVNVEATSTINTSIMGSSTVTLWHPTPGIINISPNTINAGAFSNTVNGRSFVSGLTATFGGVPLAVTYLSSTQILVSGSTSAAPGTSLPLVVTNPQPGSASSTLNFTVQPAIAVTITPASASLMPGATQVFGLTVTNTSNRAVNWLVNGIRGGNSDVGTIVSTSANHATYTAPAVPPTPNTVNIQAQSVQNADGISLASVVTLASPTISVYPPAPSVRAGANQQFSASATGLSGSQVTWAVNGIPGGSAAFGTITGAGLYTGPPTIAPGTVNVQATSTINTSIVGSSTVTLWNPAPGIINIAPNTINAGAFSNTVNGRNFVSGLTATFGGAPLTVTYLSSTQIQVSGSTSGAPGTSLPLVVTNPQPGSASSTLNFTVQPAIAVTITPATASVRPGDTQVFNLTVTNTSNRTANWLVNGIRGGNSVVGTIVSISAGQATYTAPALPPSPNPVTVQAQSVQDTSAYSPGSTVTILNPTPAITSLSPTTIHFGAIAITVNGAGFVPESVVTLGSTSLQTQFVSDTQIIGRGTAVPVLGGLAAVTVVSPGVSPSNFLSVQIQEAKPLMSYQSAFHFLEQATWGPTPKEVDHLQQVGFTQWFNEQLNAPLSTYSENPADLSTPKSEFFVASLSGQDQLRQRVAFALGQIFCISALKDSQPAQIIPYQKLLEADAFSNYLQIMQDVTLNPSMGRFLDMVDNKKPAGTAMPNQNYARELLQLFSIGTHLLNPNGSPKLDGSGKTIPSYDENTIQNFARVFTGWTFPVQPGTTPQVTNPPYYTGPMIAWEPNHDSGAKTLLNGYHVPAGLTAAQDLQVALQNILDHPNVGPFVAFRLIQHLVSSNPSPAYVQRIAQVFANDGSGTRGNMWAVVQAILNDSEARKSDNVSTWIPTSGQLREPIVLINAILRELDTPVTGPNQFAIKATPMGQELFYPPSVFGYFPPNYALPGNSTMYGPEFNLVNSSTALATVNWIYSVSIGSPGPGVKVDLSPFLQFANDPATLIKAMSNALMAGQMPTQMQTAIATALSTTTDLNQRVRDAFYLTAASPLYLVQR